MTLESTNLSRRDLAALELARVGENVLVNRTCQIFGASRIRLGSNVRIDAFCMLSAGDGGIEIGNYVHLAPAVAISGAGGVIIEDFCGLSGRVSIFSSNDDYSGGYMTNPMVPDEFRNVTHGRVILRRHAIVGAGSVILPGVTIGLGASVGALTLVNRSIPDFAIVSGNPMRKIGKRDEKLLELEAQFLSGDHEHGR